MQPQAMTKFVKGLNLPVDVTPRTLNRSYLVHIAEQQYRYGDTVTAMLNLEKISQLHRATIARLTKRSPETVEQSVKNLFS